MEIKGFSQQGNWYKGNLHSHTVNSDGKLTPAKAVALYRDHGYHFLCFSEHNLYTDYREDFDREDFLILPGLEASVILFEKVGSALCKKAHHIHGILGTSQMQAAALKPLFHHMERLEPTICYETWDGAAQAQKMVDELAARGCITTYNHPIWSRVEKEDFCSTEGLWALEIFNFGTANESNSGYDTSYWDRMLQDGKHICAFASDDNHNSGVPDDSCGGYIVVKSRELSHDSILQNMLSGNYYSSSGPEIYDWGIRDGNVYVECSPVYRIDFMAGNFIEDGISRVAKTPEDTLCSGEYLLKGHERYVRVQCTDRYGKTAWSNPIYL